MPAAQRKMRRRSRTMRTRRPPSGARDRAEGRGIHGRSGTGGPQDRRHPGVDRRTPSHAYQSVGTSTPRWRPLGQVNRAAALPSWPTKCGICVTAQRSATAAKDIKLLIGEALDSMTTGSQQVREAGDNATATTVVVAEVSRLVTSVSEEARRQRSSLKAARDALSDLDHLKATPTRRSRSNRLLPQVH